MTRRSIYVGGLNHGNNPIPAASRVGPLLATGAVRGVDRATGQLPDEVDLEVEMAFDNLETVVRAGGGGLGDIVHISVFLTESTTRDLVNVGWTRLFPDAASRPARHVVVETLPGGMRVQLEALAYVCEPAPEVPW